MKKTKRDFLKSLKYFKKHGYYNPYEVLEDYKKMVKDYEKEIIETGNIPQDLKDARIILEEVLTAGGFNGNTDSLLY